MNLYFQPYFGTMWPHQRIKNDSCRIKTKRTFCNTFYRVLKFYQIIQYVDYTNVHYVTSPTRFGLAGYLQGAHSI